MQEFYIKRRDTIPPIRSIISDANGPYNLTGCSVKFHMTRGVGLAAKVNAAANIIGDPTDGLVEYTWAAVDTDTAAIYLGEWEVTLADTTKIGSFPNNEQIKVTVTADLA
jgi:hypothetical protein